MLKWLDDNDILMYLAHNEGKSVVAEKFMRTLEDKIYKQMTAIDSKYYLGYLNYLKYLKAPKFKCGDRVRITKHKSFSSKDCTEIWSKEIFVIHSVSKTDLWTYKIIDLN